MQLPLTDEQKERHENVLTGYHTAATALGNTSTFVSEYYIHPQVVSVYEDGNFEPYYKKATSYKPKNSLDSTERYVQEIIDNFKTTLHWRNIFLPAIYDHIVAV